jgi:hypothetical protein
MNIYVDGCSYTYGYGLDRRFSLANLLSADSIDKSCVGKSNYTVALDLYESDLTSDLYVIGWTYSDRTEFNFDNKIIQASASRTNIRLDDLQNAEYFEKEYHELQNKFYRYSSRQNILSDFFIDAVASILTEKNKKFIFFSWEHRNCKTEILYPKIVDDYRQQDIVGWETLGHLTEDGMQYLANIIMEKINE